MKATKFHFSEAVFKKLLISLTALSLLVSCLGIATAQEANVFYQSSFGAGDDGWYARGATRSYHTTEATLRTEGRTSDWNSPGRNFELVPDNLYELSVEVFQDEADSAAFMISIAHSKDGQESYENLAHGTAKKGEWTTLTGSWTAGDFETYILYVETTGAPTLSFEIRNFTVSCPNGIPTPRATEPPMVLEAVENLPSLKDAYAGKFDFGAAGPGYAFSNAKLKSLMAEQFSILTPENELKPDSVLDVVKSRQLAATDDTAVAVHFTAAKPLLDFAKENGLKVHGHVLVWHSQTPAAFFHEGYNESAPFVSREVMLARLENYIRLIMETLNQDYPGVVVSWDVVNEAIDDGTSWLRSTSPWTKVVGEDFVARAFEYARKYAPEGTLLYYNDYNTPEYNKLKGIVRLLESLIPEGNIDGYGFQMHYKSGYPSMEKIANAVKTIEALGMKLRVSELDIGIVSNGEAAYNSQAEKYARIMKLLLAHSENVEAVQVWGISDNMSWRGSEYPLLFDKDLNPKPAFYAVLDPNTF